MIACIIFCVSSFRALAAPPEVKLRSTWPQAYSVTRDETSGILSLRTPYYTIEQDLRKGGAITRISLQHGKATNLLAHPIETSMRNEAGAVLNDLRDTAPKVTHRREALNEIVIVDCALVDEKGIPSELRVQTTLTYRWGYIKVHKEFRVPSAGMRVRELSPFSTILIPSLSNYGYREGLTEEEGAPPFSFGSNRWGKLRLDHPSDPPLKTRYVPRSVLCADAGIEGLEWFAGSDLSQWELQGAGRRGQGLFRLEPSASPPGLAVAIAPVWNEDTATTLSAPCVFDFYLAVPILGGHAQRPWLHTSFNRNHGNWVSSEEIQDWANKGIQTAHCHNDGDYYGDGLFWRDGSYPPYPDMERFDQVLKDCRKAGIATATYFSNKELHPSTQEFREHGDEWGRKNRQGNLQHNFFKPGSEFGAQMCLRSDWLAFLKLSIDRVLKNPPLNGVYYDWNVALYCCNPVHGANHENTGQAKAHWDMDELLDLMEWTRNRVGPDGLVIIHNTTTPMFATENFADCVVATEWGYKKWTDSAPSLEDLPLEWSLAGARRRGVISYGVLNSQSPRRLHKLFAIEAFLGGVSPWPASEETYALQSRLKRLGDFESYRFADWRNQAVDLSDNRCASAVYSRAGECYLLLANLEPSTREVMCTLHPEMLPVPLAEVHSAKRLATSAASNGGLNQQSEIELNVRQLLGEGVKIELAGDDVTLVHIQ